MSEVKRYWVDLDGGTYPAQMHGCNDKFVKFADFDAQRLRADTAEAERVSANADKEAYAQNAIDLHTSLDAVTLNLKRADNLISARTSENQQLRKLLEQTLAALSPTAKLSKSIRAALNPNPEAESHE